MRCVITGVAGFIGSHVAEHLLRNGHSVTGIDCFTDYYPRAFKESNLKGIKSDHRFHFIEQNLLEAPLRDIFEGKDAVFHLAAQAGVRASWGQSFSVYTNNNVLATQMVLEASRNAKIPSVVYASSSSVYGEVSEFPMRESAVPRPYSPYGVTKLAGENLCGLYSRNYGLHTVSLRYFTVFGPRQRPDMAFHIFGKAALDRKQPSIFGDGHQTRDFTYVDDAVEATCRAAFASMPPGTVMNIGGGSRITLLDAVRILYDLAGVELMPVYERVQKGDVTHTAADITCAQKFLNYQPVSDLKTGLFNELAWLKSVYGV